MKDLELVGRYGDDINLELPDIDKDVGISIRTDLNYVRMFLSIQETIKLNKWLTKMLKEYK